MNGRRHIGNLGLMFLLTGCAGAVPLKSPREFTPSVVKAIQYDDQCRLQAYFDAGPGPYIESQSVMLRVGSQKGSRGRATYQLKAGPQRETFQRLLRTFYRSDPRLQLESQPRVTVPFYERASARHLPIGAILQIRTRKGVVRLGYHPCLGEFFFGERTYAARRAIFGKTRTATAPLTLPREISDPQRPSDALPRRHSGGLRPEFGLPRPAPPRKPPALAPLPR